MQAAVLSIPLPEICNFLSGLFVPIPTFPEVSDNITSFSTLSVLANVTAFPTLNSLPRFSVLANVTAFSTFKVSLKLTAFPTLNSLPTFNV